MNEFKPSGFFVLRTPLLPIQDFLDLSRELGFFQTLHQGSEPASAAAADRKLVRARLQKLVDRAEVQEALWLASPEFFEALSLWRKEPESEKGTRLEHSLYRYVARMTSRATPFGLFAGCTLGKLGSETRLEIGPRTSYCRRSRLDMEYLCNLADKISSDPALHDGISFRPNTSLYLAGGRYHHSQGYLVDGGRSYRLVGTQTAPYLNSTLERASSGATPHELARALVKDWEVRFEEAQNYIRKLIESQVLVSDLTPPITGPEPVEDMLAHLDGVQDPSIKPALYSISERLHKLDQGRLGNDLRDYREIINTAKTLPAEFKSDHLVQVDLTKPATRVSLDQQLAGSILHAVEALRSLVPAPKESPLEQFKKDFRERYQDQEVPLLLALDEEIGIGFERNEGPSVIPEPLLENLDFATEDNTPFRAGQAEFILLRKLQELALEGKTTLELNAKFLESVRVKNPLPLPDAFAVMGSVIGPSDPPDKRPVFFLQGVSGPSGALLLGRFCHADSGLATCVQEHLRVEESLCGFDGAVLAEVAHLPEGRIGNILYRPHLRDHEIPFLASSRAQSDRQIAVADLMVSVANERITLRSRRLGREVIPRLTSAHGYAHERNLKLYKFLCLLQTQAVASALSWDWGILDQSLFLPRVVFKNVVLAPARWRLTKELIAELDHKDRVEMLRRAGGWRNKMRVPRFALLAEADHQLLIDFENVLSVETLVRYIRQRDSARLVEMLPAPDQLCAHGPEGRFTNEVVIPFVRRIPVKLPPMRGEQNQGQRAASESRHFTRSFMPGSEWLFARIYASPSQVDHLLLKQVAPLVGEVSDSGEADGWFFVRYADPEWHLRLRFHGEPERLHSSLLSRLRERLEGMTEQGQIWRVQFDTYEREVERYGGPAGIQVAERLFHLDSALVLDLLATISDDLGGQLRWRLAFCSADTLLAGMGLDLRTRQQLVNSLEESLERNFPVDQKYKKQLSSKFRDERPALEKLFVSRQEEIPVAAEAALRRYAGQLLAIRTELDSLLQAGELRKTLRELAASYIHMHLNRIFRSAANAQEMVLYDFLGRIYESSLARAAGR